MNIKHLINTTVILLAIAIVFSAVMFGLNFITGPIIEENNKGAEFAPLLAVMPDADNFEEITSTLSGVPASVLAVYKETSGKGFVVRASASTQYSKEPMEITFGVTADGKICGIQLDVYTDSIDFRSKDANYIGSYLEKDSALADIGTVSGATYSSTAFKNAVADAMSVLTANSLVQAGVKNDDQILQELIPTVAPGYNKLVEITALTPEEGGGVTTVTLVVHASAGDIQGERYTLRLLTVSCLDLNLTVGEISARRLGELRYAEELYRAVIKSLELLGYGSMSRRRLGDKLMARGFSREIAYGAVDYVAERGYMDDADTADRFARRGIAKLWGPRRIKEDLFARGYTAEVIEIAMSELDDVDFAQNCATVIRKKYGGIPVDMAARRKLAAALVRQGYASEHINRAMRDELD